MDHFLHCIKTISGVINCRYSVPFFYEPNLDTNLNCKIPKALLPAGSEEKYPLDPSHFSYASFLLYKLPIYAEYRYCKVDQDSALSRCLSRSVFKESSIDLFKLFFFLCLRIYTNNVSGQLSQG